MMQPASKLKRIDLNMNIPLTVTGQKKAKTIW